MGMGSSKGVDLGMCMRTRMAGGHGHRAQAWAYAFSGIRRRVAIRRCPPTANRRPKPTGNSYAPKTRA